VPWSNTPGSPNYVSLKKRLVSPPGSNRNDDFLYHETWINNFTPCSFTDPDGEVLPGEIAHFEFLVRAGVYPGNVTDVTYFQPYRDKGAVWIENDGDMNWLVNIQSSVGQWSASPWMANNCAGPIDGSGYKWYQPEFSPSSWTAVSIPISSSACNTCDRYFRYWYDYEGAESGLGVSVYFQSDDALQLYVNGYFIGEWGWGCHTAGCVNGGGGGCANSASVPWVDISSYLHKGVNLIATHLSEREGGEYFSLQLQNLPLSLANAGVCCLGDACQQLGSNYSVQDCATAGGIAYVGACYDCSRVTFCGVPESYVTNDPLLQFQTSAPVPSLPATLTFALTTGLPATAYYVLPDELGGNTIYLSNFTGSFDVLAELSSNPDTVNLRITRYNFEGPSVLFNGFPTGPNRVILDTGVIVSRHGTFAYATRAIDLVLPSLITNDVFPLANPIKAQSWIRGHFDPSTGLLVAGTTGFSELPGCMIDRLSDLNNDGNVNASDIIVAANYVFKSGPTPVPCAAAGDFNCTGTVTASDIIGLVNFAFKSGTPPCDVCTIIPGTWSCP